MNISRKNFQKISTSVDHEKYCYVVQFSETPSDVHDYQFSTHILDLKFLKTYNQKINKIKTSEKDCLSKDIELTKNCKNNKNNPNCKAATKMCQNSVCVFF